MRNNSYVNRNKSKVVTRGYLVVVSVIVSIGLNPAWASDKDVVVDKPRDGESELKVDSVCPGRKIDELLEIIGNSKHKVLFYEEVGHHKPHINKKGYIKLMVEGGVVKRVMMSKRVLFWQDSRLNHKVKIFPNKSIVKSEMPSGHHVSMDLMTEQHSDNFPESLPHRYMLEFFLPCGSSGSGSFMFSFFDADADGQPVVGEIENETIGDVGPKSHSRGTGGGQSN